MRLAARATSLPATLPRMREIDLGARFLSFLFFILLGYALAGRGFAYVGIPPLFVGEIGLLFGIVAIVTTRSWWRVLNVPQVLLLLALMVWGTLRTLPYVS